MVGLLGQAVAALRAGGRQVHSKLCLAGMHQGSLLGLQTALELLDLTAQLSNLVEEQS